jgi:hypothetical protein
MHCEKRPAVSAGTRKAWRGDYRAWSGVYREAEAPLAGLLAYHYKSGDPERIRTVDLQIRNLMLYPTELRGLKIKQHECKAAKSHMGLLAAARSLRKQVRSSVS